MYLTLFYRPVQVKQFFEFFSPRFLVGFRLYRLFLEHKEKYKEKEALGLRSSKRKGKRKRKRFRARGREFKAEFIKINFYLKRKGKS
jgi:hypothetical protein